MRLLACCFIVIFASSLANDAVARDTPDRPALLAEVSLDDVLRLLGEHSPWVDAEMAEAARILDIDRRTLYRRLEVASGSEDLP